MKKIEKGFTLIELILYMGLFCVLVSVLSGIFTAVIDTQLNSKATASVDQDGRYILAKLIYDMQSASSSAIPSASSLGSPSATLQLNTSAGTYTYASNSGNLQLTNANGTNNLNSVDTQISGLTFTRIGNGTATDTIRVNFTVKSTTNKRSGLETRAYQTTLGIQ